MSQDNVTEETKEQPVEEIELTVEDIKKSKKVNVEKKKLSEKALAARRANIIKAGEARKRKAEERKAQKEYKVNVNDLINSSNGESSDEESEKVEVKAKKSKKQTIELVNKIEPIQQSGGSNNQFDAKYYEKIDKMYDRLEKMYTMKKENKKSKYAQAPQEKKRDPDEEYLKKLAHNVLNK